MRNFYHPRTAQAISCKIICAAPEFFKQKGEGADRAWRLKQVVVEAVDHFNGVEQHNAPARCHNKPGIAKLLQGGADRGLGRAHHGGELLLRNVERYFAGLAPALGGAQGVVCQRNEQAGKAVGHVAVLAAHKVAHLAQPAPKQGDNAACKGVIFLQHAFKILPVDGVEHRGAGGLGACLAGRVVQHF